MTDQDHRTRRSFLRSVAFVVPAGHDERYDRFVNSFRVVRAGRPPYEDADFEYRAAPALLCNESNRRGHILGWDLAGMNIVS
jgi:hypothetical protein